MSNSTNLRIFIGRIKKYIISGVTFSPGKDSAGDQETLEEEPVFLRSRFRNFAYDLNQNFMITFFTDQTNENR